MVCQAVMPTYRALHGLYHELLVGLFDPFLRANRQAFQQPAKLLPGQLTYLIGRPRPLESSRFQTLIEEQEAISLPVEGLEAITSTATEEIEDVLAWILTKGLEHQGSQAIDLLSKIGIAACQIDLGIFREI